jgi:hypothetical protein
VASPGAKFLAWEEHGIVYTLTVDEVPLSGSEILDREALFAAARSLTAEPGGWF